MNNWVARHFVLLSNGILISCKVAGDGSIHAFKIKAVLSSASSIELTNWKDETGAFFQITADEDAQPIHLRCENEDIRARWLTALRGVSKDNRYPIRDAKVEIGADGGFQVVGGRVDRTVSLASMNTINAEALASAPEYNIQPYSIYDSAALSAGRVGLWENVHKLTLHAFESAMRPQRYGMLIVDEPATKALSATCRVSELVNINILNVESLEKEREAVDGMDIVYLIDVDHVSVPKAGPGAGRGRGMRRRQKSVSLTSLQRVIADFDRPYRDAPRYTNCRVTVYFLSMPMEKPEVCYHLSQAKNLQRAMQNRVPQYLSNSFEIVQSRVFSLNEPRVIERVLTNSADEAMQSMAVRIAEACCAMNEYPYIRYKLSSPQSTRLASMVQEQLDGVLRSSDAYHFHGEKDVARRSTLIILMRQDDLASPLLHDFNFQALVRDVLEDEIDEATSSISYTAESGDGTKLKKVFYLNSTNLLWRRHRHDHILDVMEEAIKLVKQVASGGAANLDKDGGMALRDLADITSNLSSELELREKSSQLLRLSKRAMTEVNQRGLVNLAVDGEQDGVAELEQQLVCGLNAEGRSITPKKLLDRLIFVLQNCGSQADCYRLVALSAVATTFFGDPKMQQRILEAARLTAAQREAVQGLYEARRFALQIEDNFDSGRFAEAQKAKIVARAKAASRQANSVRYELQRTKSVLFQVAEEAIQGGLQDDIFPYTRAPPPGAGLGEQQSNDASASKGGSGARRQKPSARSVRKQRPAASVRTRRRRSAAGDDVDDAGHGALVRNNSEAMRTADTRNRLIVFIAGGLSYGEIQQLHELAVLTNIDIVLGSTEVLTPSRFLRHIEDSNLNDYY